MTVTSSVRTSMRSPKLTLAIRLVPLPAALIATIVLAVMVGAVSIPPQETLKILLYKLHLYGGRPDWSIQDQDIIWSLRLPRVIAAALVGSGLSVAGALFQAVLRNPLADPYVIGTSAGAQVGVTLALILPYQVALLGFGPIQLFAFIGAVLTVLLVYSLARTHGRTAIVTLLLAGFVVSSFLISATTLLFELSGRLNQVMTWTLGSINAGGGSQLSIVAPLIIMGTLVAYLLAPNLDVLLLGEEHAAHLGVRVETLKLGAIILASLLTALAVTVAGVIAFVGLVVPHALRLIYGPRHQILIPAAAVGGAIFVVIADLFARIVIPPTEIPLGVVTAVIGAPLFLHLLRGSRREYAL